MNAGGGDTKRWFCFLKHDERQEQPQQNNLSDKFTIDTDKGKERKGKERKGKERRKINQTKEEADCEREDRNF